MRFSSSLIRLVKEHWNDETGVVFIIDFQNFSRPFLLNPLCLAQTDPVKQVPPRHRH